MRISDVDRVGGPARNSRRVARWPKPMGLFDRVSKGVIILRVRNIDAAVNWYRARPLDEH